MPDAYVIPLGEDQSFESSWLIDAIRTEHSSESALMNAAGNCTHYVRATSLYIYFVSPDRPNQVGAEWQFERNVHIENSKYGEVVIDVLKDGRIGGIEFLSNVYAAASEGRFK